MQRLLVKYNLNIQGSQHILYVDNYWYFGSVHKHTEYEIKQ